jgi:molybdopterin molybdotransferase
MLSYDEALQMVLQTVHPLPPLESPLTRAVGRVLAAPVAARWDLPPADNSAMDGYAFAFAGQDAGTVLRLVGSSFAGHPHAGAVAPGEAVRITTGAPLPAGTDTVVPQEETERQEQRLRLIRPPKAEQHVRRRGEEFRSGEILAEAGTRLTAGEIALLASAGVDTVCVHPLPRVAILSTGDELVELGATPGPGQIVNSNLHLLMARLAELGCEAQPLGIARDTPEGLSDAIRTGLQADLLLSSGGVSVGEKDHVQETLLRHGFARKFWKVAIKPGKPVLFGTIGATPVFGLPGNPAATAATFELFVKPALRLLAGERGVRPVTRKARLAGAVKGGGDRQAFLWCRLEWDGEEYRVSISNRQGSGQSRSIQGANALLAIPLGKTALEAGERVEVLVL